MIFIAFVIILKWNSIYPGTLDDAHGSNLTSHSSIEDADYHAHAANLTAHLLEILRQSSETDPYSTGNNNWQWQLTID